MNKVEYKVTVCDNGRQEWRNENGDYHRLDGPAIISGDHRQWRVNGKLHRLDGPAYVDWDIQSWWVDDKLHRLDGPAWINGDYQEWYIEGKKYTKKKFDSYIAKMNQPTIPKIKTIELDGKLYEIKLVDGQ